ncbi:hypothetical protein H8356DRAFT_1338429 [Neocallimastix lanati (nom. inval.)]|nr:hypothetical protein H8356DRAFT_1338429 [Neocallimastix sp. JGI-2020a]
METFLLKGDIIPSKICEYRISFIYGNYITLYYNPLCFYNMQILVNENFKFGNMSSFHAKLNHDRILNLNENTYFTLEYAHFTLSISILFMNNMYQLLYMLVFSDILLRISAL